MENKRAKELIQKYLNGTCTPEEKAIIESWYLKESVEKESIRDSNTGFIEIEKEIWDKLEKSKRKKLSFIWYGAAAVVLLVTFVALYFSYNTKNNHHQIAEHKSEILPGGNKAILTLSNGSKIDLNSSEYGILAKEAGVNIRKTAEGQLVYDIIAQSLATDITYNTIETPKGGQYQVNLPDGTKVWLNAASSLKFPAVFSDQERAVEVSGEVYFEVAKDKIKPFRVKTNNQLIEVLGTHFNVNAYLDEPVARTSLLEGSVKISAFDQSVILRPGEQTVLSETRRKLEIQKVHSEDVMAWKNGYFHFNGENMETIMKKIARWYDVDVEYHKDFVDKGYVGTISRFENVSKVLRMLELTGTVHFEIKGRRIIVMP